MTSVVISQPMYFPWAGFLDLVRRADILIWLDDVQYSKGSFSNRVQVKLPSGPVWMTVPLKGKGTKNTIISLQSMDTNWASSHRAKLLQSFVHMPYRQMALENFDNVLGGDVTLCDRLIRSCTSLLDSLNIPCPDQLKSSEMNTSGSSWQRVLNLVRAAGGTHYVSAAGGANYIEHETFDAVGIDVSYIDYSFSPWPQSYGEFTPYVTGLDLLAGSGKKGHQHLKSKTLSWKTYLELKGYPAK